MDGKQTVIIIICIAAAVIIAFAVAAARKRKAKLSAKPGETPMPEISKETLNLVNDVYDEIKKEREQQRNSPSPDAQPPYDDILLNDIDPELLNDIDPELLTQLTSGEISSEPREAKPAAVKVDFSSFISLSESDVGAQSAKLADMPADARAYIDRRFYFNGVLFSDGEVTDGFIAMDGQNIRLSWKFESKKIEVLIRDGDIILINPESGKYTQMSKKLMKLMGVDEDSFSFGSYAASDIEQNAECVKYTAQADGENLICYRLSSDNRQIKLFVSDSGSLRLVINAEPDGSVISALKAEQFEAGAGEKYINTDSLKKSGLMAFFSDLM